MSDPDEDDAPLPRSLRSNPAPTAPTMSASTAGRSPFEREVLARLYLGVSFLESIAGRLYWILLILGIHFALLVITVLVGILVLTGVLALSK